jgi:hypothetical protein
MKVAFGTRPVQDGGNPSPMTFVKGELIDNGNGTVSVERLTDAPFDVPGQGVLPTRLFSVSPKGEPGWRPHGQIGPWESATRLADGLLYHDDPAFFVPLRVIG